MRGIECEIAEVEFHIEGLSTILSVLGQMHRPDPSIIHTMSYALQLAIDRRDVLVVMKELLR